MATANTPDTTIRFGDFAEQYSAVPTNSHEDLRVLMTELSDAERPRELHAPADRIRVYREFGLAWVNRVGDGSQGVRCDTTHGAETRERAPVVIDRCVAAVEALGTRPKGVGLGWNFVQPTLAAEAAHALVAVWYASRNVRAGNPLQLSDLQEVVDKITFRR